MYDQIDFDNEEESQQLEFDPVNDHCQYAKNKDIKNIISTEKFLFSDDIYKKNKFGFNQTRQVILTDLALYNLKSKKLQRRLDISKLKGITVSIAKGSLEFVIHGNESEHDYLYSSRNKYTIIYLLEIAFEKLRGRELDFIYTESASLKNRVTTKSEKKSDPKFSRMDDSELCDIKEFFKHLYYKNYEDKNERELIYIDKIDEEEINPIIEQENLVPLIRDEKKKVVDTLKMSVAPNKKMRTSLANVLISNDDKEKEGEINQDELYDLDYDGAIKKDKRTYCQYSCSLIKQNHPIVSTFFYNNDYNSKLLKINVFVLSFIICYNSCVFFYDQEKLSEIYKSNNAYKYSAVDTIYNSIITAVLSKIFKILAFSNDNI